MKSIVALLINLLRLPLFYLLCCAMILIVGVSLSTIGTGILSLWPRVIAGLLVFLLPGCLVYILAPTRENSDLGDIIGHGFAYSMALITILGLITRTLAWSIDTVEFYWYTFALLGLIVVFYKVKPWRSIKLLLPPPPPPPQLTLS